MRPVEFGEALSAGTRLTLFSADKPDRLFTVITFWMDKVSGVALDLETGVPCYQVEDEEGRIDLLLHLPIEERSEDRCCLWRPDQAGFDSRSIFDGRWWRNREGFRLPNPLSFCLRAVQTVDAILRSVIGRRPDSLPIISSTCLREHAALAVPDFFFARGGAFVSKRKICNSIFCLIFAHLQNALIYLVRNSLLFESKGLRPLIRRSFDMVGHELWACRATLL
jgi:hypothetical protein